MMRSYDEEKNIIRNNKKNDILSFQSMEKLFSSLHYAPHNSLNKVLYENLTLINKARNTESSLMNDEFSYVSWPEEKKSLWELKQQR